MTDNTKLEKLTMLALAGICISALTAIAMVAMAINRIDSNALTVIGVIVGGLIAFSKDLVAAIRSYAMSAQLGKVTDQLAASQPIEPVTPPPTDPLAQALVNAGKENAS